MPRLTQHGNTRCLTVPSGTRKLLKWKDDQAVKVSTDGRSLIISKARVSPLGEVMDNEEVEHIDPDDNPVKAGKITKRIEELEKDVKGIDGKLDRLLEAAESRGKAKPEPKPEPRPEPEPEPEPESKAKPKPKPKPKGFFDRAFGR